MFLRLRRRLRPLPPVLAAAFLIGACGGGDAERPAPTKEEQGEVRRVVNKFASGDDADACELLTEKALNRLYGGMRGCKEKAGQFEGGAVKINEVSFGASGDNARVVATSLDGATSFRIILSKVRDDCSGGCGAGAPDADWRIAAITQSAA